MKAKIALAKAYLMTIIALVRAKKAIMMNRRRLKSGKPDVREALQLALEGGAMSIRDACKAIRMLNDMSQQAFADSIGVALNVVKDIESGKGNPKLSSLEKIANAAGLKVVFAAPKGSVGLDDFRTRMNEKQASRERDFDKFASGVSTEQVSDDNAMKLPGFHYDLHS